MSEDMLVHTAVWAAPLAASYAGASLRRPDRRFLAGILLSFLWNGWVLLALNAIAPHLGWWAFASVGPRFFDASIDLWLGWTLLWGVAAPLLFTDRPLVVAVIAMLWVDLIFMPLLEPVVALGTTWLVGEAIAIAAALVPGLLLARWTAQGSHLLPRAALQVATFASVLLWIVPSLALTPDGGWERVAEVPAWRLGVGSQMAVMPIALGIRAVIEFVRVGGGSPLPFDPPRTLVMSGPYTFVRNPMQIAMVGIMLVVGAVVGSAWLIGGAAVAVAYSAGLAQWHEDQELSTRYGTAWRRYRRSVRAWIPSLRPGVVGEATLLVAYSCGICSSVGRWFEARRPAGLTVAPAELAPRAITRITYVPPVGPRSTGVAAVARALEHIHLGWAITGWILLLPGVMQVAQLVVDAFGPRPGPVGGSLTCDVHATDGGRGARTPLN